ncbi:MAG: DUF4349 domain-containing protein [bacterium]
MRCSEVKELLSSYVDGMLPAWQMQAVDEHLSLCPSCQEELQLLEQTINLLRDLPEIEPPEDLTASIMAGLPQPKVKNKGLAPFWRKFKGRPLGGWAAAAACFLLIAVIASKGLLPGFLLGAGTQQTADTAMPELASSAASGAPAADEGGAEIGIMKSAAEPEEYPIMGERIQEQRAMVMTEDAETEAVATERKIIQRAHLTLLVEDLDQGFDSILALAEANGGFIEHSGTWENEQQRSSELTLRVPVNYFSVVLSQIEELGRVERQELGGQDVTTEYVDIEARLRNFKRQEERFLEILERADTVEDILNIERELERVRGEIESLSARLKNLDNLTSLSTINVHLRQLKVSGERITPPDMQQIIDDTVQAFVSTINQFLTFMGQLVVFIGSIIPLLPIPILAWFAYRRFRGRKSRGE